MAAWLGDAISVHLVGGSLGSSIFFPFCNIAEVLVAVMLWKSAIDRFHAKTYKNPADALPDLASPVIMLQFVLFVILLAPAVAALMGSANFTQEYLRFAEKHSDVARQTFSIHDARTLSF